MVLLAQIRLAVKRHQQVEAAIDFQRIFRKYISFDSNGSAGIYYRIGKCRLSSELGRISREEKAEMRMHNTLKQRFLSRYSSKRNTDPTIEASNVKMYETHNPGFCYRRNGECRAMAQNIPAVKTLDYENIHSLLFTDGQVDIEKVLCLHLLSAHKAETLTPPDAHQDMLVYVPREQRPVERLLERSKKKRSIDNSMIKLLPIYVLDFKKSSRLIEDDEPEETLESEIVIRDGRLAARILINEQIQQLVHTVMAALQNTNPEKMSELLALVHNPEEILKVVDKPHIQKFIRSLNSQLLIYSCESFHLTQPFKATTTPLRINSKSKHLFHLVSNIRKHVLQLPVQSIWKNIVDQKQADQQTKLAVPDISQLSFGEKESLPLNLVTPEESLSFLDTSRSDQRSDVSSVRSKSQKSQNEDGGKKRGLPKYLEFINERPISQSGSRSTKMSLKSGESRSLKKIDENLSASASSSNLVEVLNDKTSKEPQNDIKELSLIPSTSRLSTNVQSSETVKASSIKSNSQTSSIREKKPIPTQKTSRTKKLKVSSSEDAESIKSKSAQKLTEINYNTKNVVTNDENKKKSREKAKYLFPAQLYRSARKGFFIGNQISGTDLDIEDLAKISQEIKMKETDKKLAEFLSTQL